MLGISADGAATLTMPMTMSEYDVYDVSHKNIVEATNESTR